jgi:hypothetical protein
MTNTLSETAAAIREMMEPGQPYQPSDLQAFAPGVTLENLREIMQELWVHRQVERSGYSGWRRHHSAPGLQQAPEAGRSLRPAETKAVKPEDLFDHGTFAGFFK